MKTRFFAIVTHELRTPLSLIVSPVEQLKLNPETDHIPAIHKSVISVVVGPTR